MLEVQRHRDGTAFVRGTSMATELPIPVGHTRMAISTPLDCALFWHLGNFAPACQTIAG